LPRGEGKSATSTPRACRVAPLRSVVDRRVEQHRSRGGEDACRQRRLQAGIDDHAQRLAGGGDEPHVEPRIVVEHRADAGEQGAGALAPGVAVGARRLAGDPLADAVVEGAAAVERDRGLEPQPGPTALHARDEADVELAGFLFARTDDDLDAGGGQTRGTLAGDQRIRIAHRHHHPADTGGDERLGAGWRAAVVRAGLEADDDGGAAHVDTAARGVAQGHHLGMRATVSWVWPRPTTRPPPSTMTQPTRGLGSQRPTACSASASASRMGSAKVLGSAGARGESFKACVVRRQG
jgi:hypothetical protein